MYRVARLLMVLFVLPANLGGSSTQTSDVDQDSEKVRRALRLGAYEDAARDARRLRTTVASKFEADSLEVARASDLLVEALVRNGEAGDQSTLTLAERIVTIKRERAGPEHLEMATSLHSLGNVHFERGEFAEALPLHQQALSIRSQLLQPDDSPIADSLDDVARTLIQMERLDEAKQLLDKSLAIREPRSDADPISLARTLELQAWLYRYSGDYSVAQAPLERALVIRHRLSPVHPDLASTIEVQGDVLYLKGEVQQARAKWAEGLELLERSLRPEHPATVGFQRRLAFSADVLGYRAESRRLVERGFEVGERSLAPCNRELVGLRQYRAISLMYDGEYMAARRVYERELTISEKCFGAVHSSTATVLYNEARLAADIGDLAEAERLYERAIRIWSAGLKPNHPYVARGLDSLAEVVAARGQPTRARGLYERALTIRRQAGGPDSPVVAWTLTNLARVTADSGNPRLAERYVAQAIDIYQRSGASDEPDHLSRVLALRGELEARRGDYTAARGSFADALSTREHIFGPTHPLTAETRTQMAAADFALGSNDAAFAAALEAEQAGRDHLRFTVRYLPERQAMAYAAKRPHGLDLALSLVTGGGSDKAATVFDSVIRSRGLILDELAARAQSTARGAADVASLNPVMVAARERFANLTLRSIKEGGVSSSLLEEARQQKEDAERVLAEQSAAMRSELSTSNAGLEEVRRALPPHSALISFVRYDRTLPPNRTLPTVSLARTTPSYVALIIRSDSEAVSEIPLGSATTLEALVTEWRAEASGGSMAAASAPQPEQAYREVGVRLRRRIWDPLAVQVRGASPVYIVPDGALSLVSFGALPVGTNRYLVEDASRIHYLSMERDLLRGDDVPSARGVLTVGGAAFDRPLQRAPLETSTAGASRRLPSSQSATQPATRGAGPSGDCSNFGALQFALLPGTADEAREVGRMWTATGAKVAVLTGNAADEHSVKAAAVGREVIHLATHGFFLSSGCAPKVPGTRSVGGLATASSTIARNVTAENPLVLAGLAFAGANRRGVGGGDQDDGILTAEEVAGLNLQGTRWVVLSACDTGVGQITSGEGVVGLRRAFEIAGARTVIMSLWSVQDEATQVWMRALYTGRLHDHLDTADAMREASVTVLRDRRAHGQSTHPFFWAGFVAAGDWR
jgi:CHAT domain-containing protein/tetratricopeptide (TPR) repeat protein